MQTTMYTIHMHMHKTYICVYICICVYLCIYVYVCAYAHKHTEK